MPSNTQYNPTKISDFNKDDLEFAGDSIYLECAESSEQSADFGLLDDMLITGGVLLVQNGNMGDRVFFEIVHPLAGVVNQFIKNFVVTSGTFALPLEIDYPAKLVAGLTIRIRYVANSEVANRKIAVNLFLHKVLN